MGDRAMGANGVGGGGGCKWDHGFHHKYRV